VQPSAIEAEPPVVTAARDDSFRISTSPGKQRRVQNDLLALFLMLCIRLAYLDKAQRQEAWGENALTDCVGVLVFQLLLAAVLVRANRMHAVDASAL
jgi:hypothetical protein